MIIEAFRDRAINRKLAGRYKRLGLLLAAGAVGVSIAGEDSGSGEYIALDDIEALDRWLDSNEVKMLCAVLGRVEKEEGEPC